MASFMFITNLSANVTNAQVQLMAQACNQALPLLCLAWSVICPRVVFVENNNPILKNPAPSDWIFNMIDSDPNVPDALAYHTEVNDQVDGNILVQTILANGGVLFYQDATTPTVASALFHELAEALLDPNCNGYWQPAGDTNLYAAEVCDPVQGGIFTVNINGTKIGLSDFILPAWRDSEATTGPFNYLDTLQAPFTLDTGGYVVVLDSTTGESNQIYGEKMPNWLRTVKASSHRIVKRHKHHKKHKHDEL